MTAAMWRRQKQKGTARNADRGSGPAGTEMSAFGNADIRETEFESVLEGGTGPGGKENAAEEGESIIQSPMGGEITPEAILAKVVDVDKVYVRVDVNKAYWVRGEESGDVDLW